MGETGKEFILKPPGMRVQEHHPGISADTGILITPKALHYLRHSCNFLVFLGTQPCQWKKDWPRAMPTKGWKRSLWRFVMISAMLYPLYLISRSVQVSTSEDITPAKRLHVQTTAVFYLMSMVFYVALLQNSDEMVTFINAIFSLGQETQRKYTEDPSPDKKPLLALQVSAKTMQMTIIAFILMAFPPAIASVGFPRTPEQPLSWAFDLSASPEVEMLIRVLNTAIIVYEHIAYVGSCIFVVNVGLFSAPLLMLMLHELDASKAQVTTEELRDPGPKLRMYKSLYIGLEWFNAIYGRVLIPGGKFLLILTAIFFLVGSAKQDGIVAVIIGISGIYLTIFLMGGCIYGAEPHYRSSKLRRKWLGERHRYNGASGKWWDRSVLALQDIRVKVWSMYYMDRNIVLTVGSIIIENTVNLLLMT